MEILKIEKKKEIQLEIGVLSIQKEINAFIKTVESLQ